MSEPGNDQEDLMQGFGSNQESPLPTSENEDDISNNNNNNTIYLQLAEEIAKANKGQLYTTFTIFSKNN